MMRSSHVTLFNAVAFISENKNNLKTITLKKLSKCKIHFFIVATSSSSSFLAADCRLPCSTLR